MANILMVDDSKTSRKILRQLFEGAGHTIVGEASNGEEGFIKFRELKPDLVTMDITMPVMDGIEALQLMKREDENAKVVMITALGQKEKMLKAIKCGASEFITKPFEDADVLNVINKLLEA